MFRGQLVELKAVDPNNVATYTRWWQDPDFLRLLSPAAIKPINSDNERRMLERLAKGGPESVTFGVHVLTDGALIGNISLQEIEPKNRSASLGVAIGDRGYWGKGFGSEAIRLLLRYGFYELNLHRIWLKVIAYNERAIRAYRKVGFVEEGRFREAVYRDGRYWDELYMAMLRTEYEQLPAGSAAVPAPDPAGD